VHSALVVDRFAATEGSRSLLGNANEHHPVIAGEARPVPGGHLVLALTTYEVDQRHLVLVGERLDGLDEPIAQRTEQRRRGDRLAEMVTAECHHLAERLERRDVPTQVQPVETGDGQTHVVAEYGGDVGARHRRRLPQGQVQARRWCHPNLSSRSAAVPLPPPCLPARRDGAKLR
jgi:hypothetical protein